MSELVRAAHLAPSVGPFTIRRLLFRAGIFDTDHFNRDDLRRALPIIEGELREFLAPGDFANAQRDLRAVIGAPAND